MSEMEVQITQAMNNLRKTKRQLQSARNRCASSAVVAGLGLFLWLLLGEYKPIGLLASIMMFVGMLEWIIFLVYSFVIGNRLEQQEDMVVYLMARQYDESHTELC